MARKAKKKPTTIKITHDGKVKDLEWADTLPVFQAVFDENDPTHRITNINLTEDAIYPFVIIKEKK